ncbi:interferon-induced very large GTPase 1-like [Lytechinus variegatus]|uniref:interferon-induced very large GTPase 1-like n=1 Tax=Lytechinus variegatus TaxID=7654 RepID=UPI001BB0D7DB|nr:interferon-induced very large GTPase 1-like [Lytechinus variegatus]
MLDFHARDHLLSEVNKSTREGIPDNGGDFDFESLLEMHSTGIIEDNATHLNPLDVLVAIFTCCDNFLKQTLAQKLFVCKLAIPFLYPLESGGNVGMSLWALRAITVQWHSKENGISETSVTGKPFPVVTFIRLGRPPMSKSKLANDILRDESHDTFFHLDCNNGTVPRRMSDGLVECSWFVTGVDAKQHLPDTTMILNLRGDASLMEKQMQILQETSSVVFVMTTPQDLARASNTITLQRILKSSAKVILLLISGSSRAIKPIVRACSDAVGKDLLKEVKIILSTSYKGIHKNTSELKTESRLKLSEAIRGCSVKLVEECARSAKKMGIIIDEYGGEACLEGKLLAENIVSHMEGKQIIDCKHLLLPLQGAEWTEYWRLVKMRHSTRGQSSQLTSENLADRVKQKVDHFHKKQVDILKNRRTPFIIDFMSILQKNSDVVMYFLKWMELLLDEISRANIPGLRRHYYRAWTHLTDAKKEEIANLSDLIAQVDNAESRLARASFGLENLFRELGQIYEVGMGSGIVRQDTRACVEILPEIAAKLLLKGSPLELVDGDTSSVPITWVTAVLRKLGNIIGEKKLFVLSVLGIQSSGKSTLLNTMFGLHFAVSAGRCTRGAYMQLIPVEENADLPFDYVVVVDTEGLRAPELQQLMYEHDNELATLVIGLGDVTMINIKGENTAEMKGILQMAVLAFLRVNRVSKLCDHRTCIFVHQNVPSANAEQLVMYGSQKLEESLDEMAKEAAFSENIENVHSFSQIFSFGAQTHVWYFPDLWHGNPPMAPANPGYSEKVREVRSNLLEEIAKRQTTFLTSLDLSIRLADLWKWVLVDDFAFSFASLEVKAYDSLQSKYYSLESELNNEFRLRLYNAEITLKRCGTIDELDKAYQLLNVKLSKVLNEKAEEIKVCLKEYFENCTLRKIVMQWQISKLAQFDLVVEQQRSEGKAHLLSIKEAHRVEIIKRSHPHHETYIMNKTVELAEELKDQEMTDTEQKQKFDSLWESMVQELAPKSEDKELQMDLVIKELLCQIFHDHRAILRYELRLHPLHIPLEQTSLESSISVDDIRQEHVNLKIPIWKNIKNLTPASNLELEAKQEALSLTRSILNEISTYLKQLFEKDLPFRESYAKKVMKILLEKIECYNYKAHSSNDYNVTILPNYVVKLAVHLSRHCVQVFTLMQTKYNKKHVNAKIQIYKNTAWILFKNKVSQRTEQVTAGDLVCTY